MRFIHHPGADLALAERSPQGGGTQLFRRYQKDTRVSQPDLLQRMRSLGHGQQAVDRHTGSFDVLLQTGHLVGHQRNQRRDDDRQRTGLVIARQRGNLVAERLPRAGGQNSQHVAARHRLFDDHLLQGAAHVVCRIWTKVVKAEPPLQLLAGIMPLPAPATVWVRTGHVPEATHEPARLRKLMAHPGRHDRIAARDRKPCQRIRERPSVAVAAQYPAPL